MGSFEKKTPIFSWYGIDYLLLVVVVGASVIVVGGATVVVVVVVVDAWVVGPTVTVVAG